MPFFTPGPLLDLLKERNGQSEVLAAFERLERLERLERTCPRGERSVAIKRLERLERLERALSIEVT